MAAKKKKTSKAVKAAKKKTPAKKAKTVAKKAKGAKKKTVKAAKKKAPARKAVAKKVLAKKAVKKAVKKTAKKKQVVGEGDYAATRKFDKDQASFVEKNRSRIPALGEAAEKALEGPEGDALRDAEATAAGRSRDIF